MADTTSVYPVQSISYVSFMAVYKFWLEFDMAERFDIEKVFAF